MTLIDLAERGYLPDWLVRMGIRRLLAKRLDQERRRGIPARHTAEFAALLKQGPLALATDEANEQHYEVPSAFFETVLGPRLKYSSCLYPDQHSTLAQAEEAMLRLACERAGLQDGMDVLELGCGWGSLALWIAEHYPRCKVVALSNSASQRRLIEQRATARNIKNLTVITCNMVNFTGTGESFDRILSVEMFEHMRNYELLLSRIASWLRPEGKLFVHIFCHREMTYPFETVGQEDWMARHFFRDGLMPSFDLFDQFQRDMVVTKRWQVDGREYARTCEDWLRNLDANRERAMIILGQEKQRDSAAVMVQRWRIFFMACAELFRYREGQEWFVGHYLFEPRPVLSTHEGSMNHVRNDQTPADSVVTAGRSIG